VRNEAFEPYLAHGINCANLIGVNLTLDFSAYNDVLVFTEIPEVTDYVVLWLNWERISLENLPEFFNPNSQIANWANDSRFYFVLPSAFGNHNVSKFESDLEKLGWPADRQIKGKNSLVSKTSQPKLGYSREELDSISSVIGLKLPAKNPQIRVRALILDLDNTLYKGIFGEDSGDELGTELSHILLQRRLKQLRNSGILLCIASKNNLSDLESILHSDLISELSREDFAIIEGGWSSKAESILRILNQLNFSEQFVVFIDDNFRELYEVGRIFPNLLCIDGNDPDEVLAVLETSLSFEVSSSDAIVEKRLKDVKGSTSREFQIKELIGKDSMHVDLNTQITARLVINAEDLMRANELFRKTNQFNLTLGRTQLDGFDVSQPQYRVIISTLMDKFSDSGTISSIYCREGENQVEIIEFVISCRALGRDVEKYILRSMLDKVIRNYENTNVIVKYNVGPKNQPASNFLKNYFKKKLDYWVLDLEKLAKHTDKWYSKICDI
jgi:FkbH-like protein